MGPVQIHPSLSHSLSFYVSLYDSVCSVCFVWLAVRQESTVGMLLENFQPYFDEMNGAITGNRGIDPQSVEFTLDLGGNTAALVISNG